MYMSEITPMKSMLSQHYTHGSDRGLVPFGDLAGVRVSSEEAKLSSSGLLPAPGRHPAIFHVCSADAAKRHFYMQSKHKTCREELMA